MQFNQLLYVLIVKIIVKIIITNGNIEMMLLIVRILYRLFIKI